MPTNSNTALCLRVCVARGVLACVYTSVFMAIRVLSPLSPVSTRSGSVTFARGLAVGVQLMASTHYLQVDESPLKRFRGGPLRECQAQNELQICNRKRRPSCDVPRCLELSSSPQMGKLPRNDSNGAVVGAALQQSREQQRDMFAGTTCTCCHVAYQTLERRGFMLPDYEPYCKYCMWADLGLFCRSCCRGGAGHP